MTEHVENGATTMDRPSLIDAVRKQIEYYFSKENLLNDAFLVSQMDANSTVPIAVVMKVDIDCAYDCMLLSLKKILYFQFLPVRKVESTHQRRSGTA